MDFLDQSMRQQPVQATVALPGTSLGSISSLVQTSGQGSVFDYANQAQGQQDSVRPLPLQETIPSNLAPGIIYVIPASVQQLEARTSQLEQTSEIDQIEHMELVSGELKTNPDQNQLSGKMVSCWYGHWYYFH